MITRSLFWLTVVLTLLGHLHASELDYCVERITSSLFNGVQIPRKDIEDLFNKVKTSNVLSRRGSDTSEDSSASTLSSTSSHESIGAVEEALEEWIDESEKSPKQLAARKNFTKTLETMSKARKVDDITLYRALEMILGKLSN